MLHRSPMRKMVQGRLGVVVTVLATSTCFNGAQRAFAQPPPDQEDGDANNSAEDDSDEGQDDEDQDTPTPAPSPTPAPLLPTTLERSPAPEPSSTPIPLSPIIPTTSSPTISKADASEVVDVDYNSTITPSQTTTPAAPSSPTLTTSNGTGDSEGKRRARTAGQ